MTIVIHPDGEVETFETPTVKDELKLRFDLLETELQLQGYETEKFFDQGSGVMTLRAVPPCRSQRSKSSETPSSGNQGSQ